MNLCKQFANVIDVHSIYEDGVEINNRLSHRIFRKDLDRLFYTVVLSCRIFV